MPSASGGFLRGLAFAACAVVATAAVYLPWLGFDFHIEPRPSAVNDYWKARVPDMIYGRAHRPYVLRTLVPSLTRLLRASLRPPLDKKMQSLFYGPPVYLPRKMGVLGWEQAYLLEYVIAISLVYCFLLAFPFALRSLARSLYTDGWVSFVAPLAGVLALPVFFSKGTHYLYDFPSLTLFTLALALMARRRWGAFYPVFAAGTLNKETMILATLVFGLAFRRSMPRGAFLKHVAAQSLLFLAIQAGLRRLFTGTPGGAVEPHLEKNLILLASSSGPLVLGLLAAAAFLILVRLGRKPAFLRQALAIMPPLALSYLCFGIYGEIRVFYEAFPVLFLLAFHNVAEALGLHLRQHETRV